MDNRSDDLGMMNRRSNRRQSLAGVGPVRAMTVIELPAVIFIVAVVLTIVILFEWEQERCMFEKGARTKDLSNAKQIFLALKLYATDHNGQFPNSQRDGSTLTNANEAYANVIPEYVSPELLFYVPHSAWTPKAPDEVVGNGHTLELGENAFAYVPNLKDTSNPSFPLVADGFKEGAPGCYTSDEKVKGGLWKGKVAIVVRVDGSGKVEQVNSKDLRVYGPIGGNAHGDIFAPAPNWLDATQVPLNPAGK